MSFRFDVLEDMLDFPVGSDQESRAGNSHDLLAIHIFFLHDPVGRANLFVDVGQQCVRQVVLFFELLLFGGRIGGNAKDDGAGLLDFFIRVTEPGRFYRSTRSIGFGVKEQHHGFAAEVL